MIKGHFVAPTGEAALVANDHRPVVTENCPPGSRGGSVPFKIRRIVFIADQTSSRVQAHRDGNPDALDGGLINVWRRTIHSFVHQNLHPHWLYPLAIHFHPKPTL